MSKIEQFWVNATAEDVAGIVKTGKLVPARFRDSDTDDWQEYSVSLKLAGWKLRRSDVAWIDADGASWNHCQVYREPSWYANKPDPGPGYRLLGKFPDEPKLGTDEAWSGISWLPIAEDNGIQRDCVWYRRRIEPVEPEPKHYVLRVGDSVETPSGHRIEIISRGETQRTYALTAGGKVTLPNGQTITITAKGFEVTQ
jgi:hypothetical protein